MNFRFLCYILLISCLSIALFSPSVRCQVPLDDEEEGNVEIDEVAEAASEDALTPPKEEAEPEEEKPLKPSPDTETTILFVTPPKATNELPAGKDVHLVVGFTNKGKEDFILETMDASFRYPMDFSFYIQNFSTVSYSQVVKPKQQASLYYTFFTSEGFSSRPFGLTVNLLYKDAQGQQYLDAVYNETVTIVELDEGLDGETFFLYIMFAAIFILLMVGGHQLFHNLVKKKPTPKVKVEIGTQNHNDVDYDWLPKEALNHINNKSPKLSPRPKRQTRSKKD